MKLVKNVTQMEIIKLITVQNVVFIIYFNQKQMIPLIVYLIVHIIIAIIIFHLQMNIDVQMIINVLMKQNF